MVDVWWPPPFIPRHITCCFQIGPVTTNCVHVPSSHPASSIRSDPFHSRSSIPICHQLYASRARLGLFWSRTSWHWRWCRLFLILLKGHHTNFNSATRYRYVARLRIAITTINVDVTILNVEHPEPVETRMERVKKAIHIIVKESGTCVG